MFRSIRLTTRSTLSTRFSLVILASPLAVLVFPLVVLVFLFIVLVCSLVVLVCPPVVSVSLLVVSVCPLVVSVCPLIVSVCPLVVLSVSLFITDPEVSTLFDSKNFVMFHSTLGIAFYFTSLNLVLEVRIVFSLFTSDLKHIIYVIC